MTHPDTRNPLLNDTLALTGTTITIADGTLAPSPAGDRLPMAPPHIHHDDDEIFYALEGTLGVRLDDEEVTVGPGGLVYVTPGTIHTWWNAGDTPLRYLLITTRRINDLIAALHERPLQWQEMKDVFRAHASELLDDDA